MSDANITPSTGGQAAMQSGLPALPGSRSGGSTFGGGAEGMKLRLTGLLQQPAVQRSLPMIGLIAVIALAALAWLALREPARRDLFRGLPDADQAAVAEALGKSGIPYGFDRTTGAITVAEDDYFNAKMKLAAEGLPRSAPSGDALIDSMPMGASRAVEGEKLRSARELDLARTIEAIDAVMKARVHLAVEPPSIFLRERSRPTASVMLQLAKGRSLSQSQVEAIVHLVASSVADMVPEAVSVVDQNGRLLSNATGAGADTDRQIQIQARIEDRYREAVTALLTPIVGAGNFSAEVHAEVNFSERQATRETYPQDEARLRAETGSWNSDAQGAGDTPGGIPGALQPNPPVNPADPAAPPPTLAEAGAAETPAAPGMPPFKTAETFNRSFELGREVSVTRDAVGTVQRLSIAVALDDGADGKPRTPQEIAALEALVKGAVGFDQARGDVVAISSRTFVVPAGEAAADAAPWYEAGWVAILARNVSALLVALVLLIGIGRPLLKRWTAAPAVPQAASEEQNHQLGTEIQAELGRAAAAHDPEKPVTLDMISASHDYSDRAVLIRNFVKQDPDRAALVVRDLLKDGAHADG